MEDRIILLWDFNAHSAEWNLHYREKRDTTGLEALIERYSLILNNKPGVATIPTGRSTTSIIDLSFTTQQVGVLEA